MFCHLCGKKVPDDARYCNYCGQRLPEHENWLPNDNTATGIEEHKDERAMNKADDGIDAKPTNELASNKWKAYCINCGMDNLDRDLCPECGGEVLFDSSHKAQHDNEKLWTQEERINYLEDVLNDNRKELEALTRKSEYSKTKLYFALAVGTGAFFLTYASHKDFLVSLLCGTVTGLVWFFIY